jgi:hypothetical protein
VSHNPYPTFRRPKRLPDSRRYNIVLPAADVREFEALQGYYADIIGVQLSLSGVVRVALREMKQRLDRDFSRTLVDSPKKSLVEFEALRAAEQKRALEANYMKIEGGK